MHEAGQPAVRLTRGNACQAAYWTPAQLVAHHTAGYRVGVARDVTLPRFHVQQEVGNFWSTENRNERWKFA
jgi:hypothetical protein